MIVLCLCKATTTHSKPTRRHALSDAIPCLHTRTTVTHQMPFSALRCFTQHTTPSAPRAVGVALCVALALLTKKADCCFFCLTTWWLRALTANAFPHTSLRTQCACSLWCASPPLCDRTKHYLPSCGIRPHTITWKSRPTFTESRRRRACVVPFALPSAHVVVQKEYLQGRAELRKHSAHAQHFYARSRSLKLVVETTTAPETVRE